MTITRAYRTALNPTPTQAAYLQRIAGCTRFVWNASLEQRMATYQQWKHNDPSGATKPPKLGWMDQGKELTIALAMEELEWLREAPRMALNGALQNLDRAFSATFRRLKNGETPGFPKYKGRRGRQGFKFFTSVRIEESAIHLPKIGRVKLHESGYLPIGTVKIASGAVTWDGRRWHVSVTVSEEIEDAATTERGVIVHLGLRKLAHLAIIRVDGVVGYDTYDHPHTFDAAMSRLRLLQRRLSRRKKGSSRREDARRDVARLHEHIASIRRDTLHKLSTEIARYRPAYIVIQRWDVAGMLGERKISRSIADAAWFELTRQITYKATWCGAIVHIVPPEFPASKTCSSCGKVNQNLLLSQVEWTCPSCGVAHDRERNALANLQAWREAEAA